MFKDFLLPSSKAGWFCLEVCEHAEFCKEIGMLEVAICVGRSLAICAKYLKYLEKDGWIQKQSSRKF